MSVLGKLVPMKNIACKYTTFLGKKVNFVS